MKMNKLLCALAAAGLLALTACSASTEPIRNPQTAVAGTLSAKEVKQAIIDCCINRGWVVSEQQPGVLTATLNVRSHQAVVQIPYSAQGYSINYVSSVDLKSDGVTIHNKYNHWVNNLDHDIKLKIAQQQNMPR